MKRTAVMPMALWVATSLAANADEPVKYLSWRAESEPIYVEPDTDFVKDPSVFVYRDGKFHMYYTGSTYGFQGGTPPWRIDYATSRDGVNWQKRGTLFSASGDSWEQGRVQAPARPRRCYLLAE